MKAIIIAAGPGKRLGKNTYDKPKCLLKIGSKTIMEIQLDALRNNGINNIVIVRGHMKDRINFSNIKYFENKDYFNNNILQSLFCAKTEINGEFVFSYSDILYNEEIVRKLLEQKTDFGLIIDVAWKKRYENRTLHPPSEAELVFVENGHIIKIAKGLDPDKSHGEFIGLAFFSERGARILKNLFNEVNEKFQNRQFHNAVTIEKAYLTDIIQELIDRGFKVKNIDIDGGWHEIDTPQDLEQAREQWKIN